MIELIIGNEGKGKTREMLDRANNQVREAVGNLVYVDKNAKHMYELNNRIRLVDISEFSFENADEFYGFICGIISQDHDLEQLYFDNFKRIACVDNSGLEGVLDKFAKLGESRGVKFCISIAATDADIPDSYKDKVIISL